GGPGMAGLLAGGSVAVALVGAWLSRILFAPLRDLGERVRRLAAAPPQDPLWDERLGVGSVPLLEEPLDELRQEAGQRMAALGLERARLEGILEGAAAGILATAKDGRTILANRALLSLLGVRGSLVGRLPVEVVRDRGVEEAVSGALRSGQATAVELALRGGTERFVEVQVSPIWRGQECIGAVSVFHDVTRLRQLERARRDFVANVSHELRTPLTAIKGYAETLADGALADRQAAERFVGVISAHADRLTRLLEDILYLSRLEAENLQLRMESCPLRALAEACLGTVAPAAVRKQVTLGLDIPEAVQVRCDGKLIEQAILNLLDNAVKYTPERGSVQVRCVPEPGSPDPPRVVVQVADTGIGIPSRDLERVFERFYRVDKGRSRALGGTGLGLAIVRHILQAHGERVWVESELGLGSTFSFSLRRA
ncbi:MAG: ATP-binding protein, partial [Candidatus Latescibacterota bacterium]